MASGKGHKRCFLSNSQRILNLIYVDLRRRSNPSQIRLAWLEISSLAPYRERIMKRFVLGTASALLLATSFVQPGQAVVNTVQESTGEQSTLVATKDVVSSGNFVTVKKQSTGSAQIISKDGKRYLELSSDFSTGKGPDVKVVLYRDSSTPESIEEGSYLSLALLEQFNGKQLFAIPDDVNLDEYGSVAIWCKQFNVTFGYAPLK